MTLVVENPGGGPGVASRANVFFSRSGAGQVQTQMGPGAAFGKALPSAFLDPLPHGLSVNAAGNIVLQPVREAAYQDVQDWLEGPRAWRRGFTERFRPRLADAAFRRALDARMSLHPEWYRIVHPPPATPLPAATK
jgi:hypothetical protein